MKYGEKSFSVAVGSKEYRDNWERIFGKKKEEAKAEEVALHTTRTDFDAHALSCTVCRTTSLCPIGEKLWEKEYGP